MTTRAVLSGLVKRGKQVLQSVVKQKTQKVSTQVKAVRCRVDQQTAVQHQQAGGLGRIQALWRQLLPKVYYNSLASQLGRQAAWRGSRNVSLLAFMGLVVAQNNEDEVDITERLNEFIKTTETFQSPLMQKIQSLSLDLFEFGEQIGQGCNAAVYEARLKPESVGEPTDDQILAEDVDEALDAQEDTSDNNTDTDNAVEDSISDTDSDITVLSAISDIEQDSRAPTEFHIDYDIIDNFSSDTSSIGSDTDSDISILSDLANRDSKIESQDELSMVMFSLEELMTETVGSIQIEEENTVFEPGGEPLMYKSMDSSVINGPAGENSEPKFDLAVKMMFNYGVESNAHAILREMDRETVPARLTVGDGLDSDMWRNGNRVRKKHLPPHPNIVEMWGVFVDPVPRLPHGLLNYPAALPSRLNPKGIGRNMTLFLVMKKYECTLKEYLSLVHLSFRERLQLVVQLLEAVDHLGRHGVAHRDMKSDNILLDTSQPGVPKLVLSDFGCCLADEENGLVIPFPTDEVDRGGNTALMAPEIISAKPGRNSLLNYTKADVWAAGALAYEILGTDNPFYGGATTGRKLSGDTYKETELPPLPNEVPGVVKGLIARLLSRDPKQRPTARQAADILHALLWMPEEWHIPGRQATRSEVKWWIVTMATEVMLETRLRHSHKTEVLLKRQFIENLNINRFFDVLSVIQET